MSSPNIKDINTSKYHSSSLSHSSGSSESLEEKRIITKNLVYVIGWSSSLANKEKWSKYEFFRQYGTIVKIVVNKGKAYNQSNIYGPSFSAYVTYSKPSEASLAILSLNGIVIDNHWIKASFGTTKYCSYFLKGSDCTNKSCWFWHRIADDINIIKRGDLIANKTIFEQQQAYAIRFADIYNSEVKKKLLAIKKVKTIFPSPDMIYSNQFVIDNDPTNNKNKRNSLKQYYAYEEEDYYDDQENDMEEVEEAEKNENNTNKSNGKPCKTENNNMICKANTLQSKRIFSLSSDKYKNKHKLFLNRETSRFTFKDENKTGNDKIEVPLRIRKIINKKINLRNWTKYMMSQEEIDKVIQNEITMSADNFYNDESGEREDEWIDFINDNSYDINNKILIRSSDEYINDFENINSFIWDRCWDWTDTMQQ